VTIQDLGSIGELLAALATIATLIYLAVQIKGSAAATRAEARRALDVSGYDVVREIAGDPGTSQLFLAGLAKPETLDAEQTFRFHLMISYFFTSLDSSWRESRTGTMSDDQFSVQLERNRPMLETPGGSAWWAANSKMFQEEFRVFLEPQIPRLKQ
jgi:hypothetical protein